MKRCDCCGAEFDSADGSIFCDECYFLGAAEAICASLTDLSAVHLELLSAHLSEAEALDNRYSSN